MPWIGKLDDNSIPLADDDPQVIINDDNDIKSNRLNNNNNNNNNNNHASSSMLSNGRSMDSLPSSYTNGSSSPGGGPNSLEPDISPDEQEDKARLISQVLELQNTLDDLSLRVDSVKEENLKLKSENLVLGQYIENLMSASSVFQSTSSPINNNNNNIHNNNHNNNNNNNNNHNNNHQSKKK